MADSQRIARIARFLDRTTLFRNLPPNKREVIAGAMKIEKFAAGARIIAQGEDSDSLYIITKGRCSVLVEDTQLGLQQVITELGTNDVFGEMGLLLTEPRSATIRAAVETVCLRLDRNAFNDLLISLPQVGLTVSQNLAARLTDQTRHTGFRFIQLNDYEFNPELYALIPGSVMEHHQLIPIGMDGKTLLLAMTRPNEPAVYEAIRRVAPGLKLRPFACGEADFHRYMAQVVNPALEKLRGGAPKEEESAFDQQVNYDPDELEIIQASITDTYERGDITGEGVVRLLNRILTEAINAGASDIHIEPASQLRVRFRISGQLVKYVEAPMAFHAPIVARIKVVSAMDISNKRRPQDGRLALRIHDHRIDCRVNTLPTVNGEKVVLRLLDSSRGLMPMDKLILSKPLLDVVRRAVLRTMGCVLVVGPTGSGKTTTLYSALRELLESTPDVNISTIENPVEYSLDAITQSQINTAAGMDFADVLRALLRQDPDIMMVGEMRDALTAQIALEGALTGHLVLSTLHANGAPEAVMRLVEMGCPPYLVASAVHLVIGQRLVRRTCPHCKRHHVYSESVRRHLESAGILPYGQTVRLFKGAGCEQCTGTGFKGRLGIYEVLQIDPSVQELIAQNPHSQVIRDRAGKANMLTDFKQYSGYLVANGHTTPSEVLRQFGH